VTTASQRSRMLRYWNRRVQRCRLAGLCVRCRKNPVTDGEQACKECRLRRKLRRCLAVEAS